MSDPPCFYDYNESLYSRRVRSKSKKAIRLSRKIAMASKAKDIRFWSKDEINKKKWRKEGQRQQWSKYNKKSKSRDWQHLKSHECVAMYGIDGDVVDDEGDDGERRSSSLAMTTITIEKHGLFLLEKSCAVSGLVEDRFRKKARVSGLFKEFHNFDCKFTQLDMNCFEGRLCFVRRLLECTGISRALFSLQYLMKLSKESRHSSLWSLPRYTSRFDGLLSGLWDFGITNEYLLYVSDEIREAVERQFALDLASAKPVIRNRGQLFKLLCESEQLNANVAEVLSTFVMSKGELLTHWKRDEDKLEKFYSTHRKIKKSSHLFQGWEEERAGNQLMSVLYQSKDMTQFALRHTKDVQMNEDFILNLSRILLCSWAQFQAYVKQQDEFGRSVKPKMLYNIMLHVMEHKDLFPDFHIWYPGRPPKKAFFERLQCAASKDPFLQHMLRATRRSVGYIDMKYQHHLQEMFRRNLTATREHQSHFFQCLHQNYRWLEANGGSIGFFREQWSLVEASSLSLTCKLHYSRLLYDLMAKCWSPGSLAPERKKLEIAERVVLWCAGLIKPCQNHQHELRAAAMRQVELKSAERWLPLSDRLSLLLRIEMKMEQRQSQEDILCLQARSFANGEQYGIDRYSRRLLSKRKTLSRKYAKASYTSHCEKSGNARGLRKLSKFRSNYLLLAY